MTLASGWRARRLGYTYCNSFKDMRNAFASSDWDELDTILSLAAAEHDRELCKQRYRDMVVDLLTPEGTRAVKIGDGLMLGDPFSVDAFCHGLRRTDGQVGCATSGTATSGEPPSVRVEGLT